MDSGAEHRFGQRRIGFGSCGKQRGPKCNAGSNYLSRKHDYTTRQRSTNAGNGRTDTRPCGADTWTSSPNTGSSHATVGRRCNATRQRYANCPKQYESAKRQFWKFVAVFKQWIGNIRQQPIAVHQPAAVTGYAADESRCKRRFDDASSPVIKN
jgi:hypothetical protein